jgi:hypothetical protein
LLYKKATESIARFFGERRISDIHFLIAGEGRYPSRAAILIIFCRVVAGICGSPLKARDTVDFEKPLSKAILRKLTELEIG